MCESEWKLMQELGEKFPVGAEHDVLNVQAGCKSIIGISCQPKIAKVLRMEPSQAGKYILTMVPWKFLA